MNEKIDFDCFLSQIKEESIRKKIILIELFSVLFTLISCSLSGYFWIMSGSITALAISADSFLDILAYLTIIWRYFKPRDINSIHRDRIAQLFFSIIFLVTAICIEFESVKNLFLKIKPKPDIFFILISILQSLIFSIISIIKFLLCQRLKINSCLYSSGVNSLMAAFGLFSIALSMSVFIYEPNIWYLDSVFGFSMGIVIFIYATSIFIAVF